MKILLATLIDPLRVLHCRLGTVLVAMDGPGGAGKSTFAAALAIGLANARIPTAVVQFDDFYLRSSHRSHGSPSRQSIGVDFDWQRLRDQILIPLGRGEEARYQRYDWNRHSLSDFHKVAANQVVIVEGIYCTRRELATFYQLRVWVDCPSDIRLCRGLERDGEAARARWELDWMPSEDRYSTSHNPAGRAHIIVDGTVPLSHEFGGILSPEWAAFQRTVASPE
jgi:uridine kinase